MPGKALFNKLFYLSSSEVLTGVPKFLKILSKFQKLSAVRYSTVAKHRRPFSVMKDSSIENLSRIEFTEARKEMDLYISKYKTALDLFSRGGGEKAIKRHRMQNKLLATERLNLILDEDSDFLELSPLAGLGMEYGDVPKAGLITGIGRVNGVYCMLVINDATIKGGTVYPITLKKQLRAQEIAEQNYLPCVYAVDSGGAYLPLQDEIFPDKNHGGRVFYNEAVLSSKGIPQVALVCGSCTAGGAYIPTMADEAIIIDKIGRIFLGGPPLVKAATGEVVTADELGGAVLHSTISGCTDYYTESEEDACAICRDVIASFNSPEPPLPQEWDHPIYDPSELTGLLSKKLKTYDVHMVIARLVDGSRFHEFKTRFGTSIVTGFAYIEGHLVGLIGNKGEITGEGALKGAHFVQLCSERSIPIVFLQNSAQEKTSLNDICDGDVLGETVKCHAKMLSAVALASVPKITIIVGGSLGINNYLMAGKSMSPNFVFLWPSALICSMNTDQLVEHIIKESDQSEEDVNKLRERVTMETSAMFSSSRLVDDGIVLPENTRKVLGQCLRIVSQRGVYKRRDAGVIRM